MTSSAASTRAGTRSSARRVNMIDGNAEIIFEDARTMTAFRLDIRELVNWPDDLVE